MTTDSKTLKMVRKHKPGLKRQPREDAARLSTLRLGAHHSEDTKEKISEGNLAAWKRKK